MWSSFTTSGLLSLILLLIVGLLSKPSHSTINSISCQADRLTVYRVIVHTFWSRERFPKHYPEWRPPAHWSKLVGRSHNESFHLFQLGKVASEGIRIFAETGASDVLDELSQGEGGVYDEFIAPAIPKGVGRAEAEFFVDGNHSRVSLISRVVPSPDWFIGIDSYDLCSNGRWIDTVTIEVDPLDAGTDSGLTFTSPNWATEPRAEVKRLTARQPNHPASSFYYTDRESLPSIASFQFIKVKEYELSEVFHHPEQEISSNDVIEASPRHPHHPNAVETNFKSPSAFSSMSNKPVVVEVDRSNNVIDYVPYAEKKRKDVGEKKKKLKKIRPPRDCIVSEWSSWTPCSKTCGLGEMTRSRNVLMHARRGGRPCPPLKEATWCGSARSCVRTPFRAYY